MASEIARIEAPSREDFEKNYLDTNTPVILTGVSNNWPAIEKWTPEYLKNKSGEKPVTVHYHKGGNFHRWYIRPWEREDRQMTFVEFLTALLESDDYRNYYMTEYFLKDVHPDLLNDVDLSKYVDKPDPFLFLGRDTFMPMHYHATTEAFLCQLQGTKQIKLYSPQQFSNLYYRPWYSYSCLFSMVDTRNPDYDEFPKFKKVVPLEFTLHPGEILFIPVHWGHATNVPDYQVSITFFWLAKRSNFHYPAPGIHVFLRGLLDKTRKTLRRRKAKAA